MEKNKKRLILVVGSYNTLPFTQRERVDEYLQANIDYDNDLVVIADNVSEETRDRMPEISEYDLVLMLPDWHLSAMADMAHTIAKSAGVKINYL